MNIVYQQLVFPFKETNLERIVDGKYFKIILKDHSQKLRVCLENEMMLLEFSKSLQAMCCLLQDYEKESYIQTVINLEAFIEKFNEGYHLNVAVQY